MPDVWALLADARRAATDAYLRTGDYDPVETILERAVAAREPGDRRAEAAILAARGMVLHFRAIELPREERAEIDAGPEQELFERALAIRRAIGDEHGIAESLWQLGLVHQVLRRDYAAAAPYLGDALAAVERLPDADPWLRSEVYRHVGFERLLDEDYDVALTYLRRSQEVRDQLAEQRWRAGGLTALAMAARLAGDADEALAYARQAIGTARADGLSERHVAAAEAELQAAAGAARQD
jgi:tetratricopeptide (TPR) repeat protein